MGKYVEYAEILGWEMGKKLTTLPLNSRVYTDKQHGRVWELYATDVDMIPRGLKGIDAVHLDLNKGPIFIAPDFDGEVLYFNKEINIKRMTQEQITLAKQRYVQYQSFVEAPRYLRRKADFGFPYVLSESTLPTNIRFYEKEKKIHLDLTKTDVDRVPEINGVDKVIFPADHKEKIAHNSKMMLDLHLAYRQYE